MASGTNTGDDAAGKLLDRIREFVATLDAEERALFAALLAPGVALAYSDETADVEAFALVSWHPAALPERLAREIIDRELTIKGF